MLVSFPFPFPFFFVFLFSFFLLCKNTLELIKDLGLIAVITLLITLWMYIEIATLE